MAEFLTALMALVVTFISGGKPATLPPHSQQEVSVRGSIISETAKNLDPQSSNGQASADTELGLNFSGQTPEGPKNDGKAFGQSVNSQAQENSLSPDTIKVEAENIKSGKSMPTLIPQVAVDHSVALEALVEEEVNAEEQNQNSDVQVNSNVNSNASFGQQIAESQPDSAKTGGQDFGQAISDEAKENSRRP